MKFFVEFESALKWRLKYKFWALATLLIAPLTDSIYHSLSGYYVKTVPYLNTFVNYALIFTTAYFIVRLYERIVYGISTHFSQTVNIKFLYIDILEFLLGKSLFHIIDQILEFIPYVVLISLFVGSIVYKVFLFSILFLFVLLPFTYSLTLFFSSLALKFRGRDFSGIREILGFFVYVAIPYSYTIFILPESFRIILYFYPPAGILEELRKYLFLGEFSIRHLLILILESVLILIMSYKAFYKMFEVARKKGWVKLT